MSPEKVAPMANQFAAYIRSQPSAMVDSVPAHWGGREPRMLLRIMNHIAAGGAGLDPEGIEAAKRISTPAARRPA